MACHKLNLPCLRDWKKQVIQTLQRYYDYTLTWKLTMTCCKLDLACLRGLRRTTHTSIPYSNWITKVGPNNDPTYWTELRLPHSIPQMTVAVAVEKEACASYGTGTGSTDYCIVPPLHHCCCHRPTCPCYHFQGHTLGQRCVPVDMWCTVDGDR